VVASGSEGARYPNRKATEDISSQIAEVQSATKRAVDNVGAITAVMGEIDKVHRDDRHRGESARTARPLK